MASYRRRLTQSAQAQHGPGARRKHRRATAQGRLAQRPVHLWKRGSQETLRKKRALASGHDTRVAHVRRSITKICRALHATLKTMSYSRSTPKTTSNERIQASAAHFHLRDLERLPPAAGAEEGAARATCGDWVSKSSIVDNSASSARGPANSYPMSSRFRPGDARAARRSPMRATRNFRRLSRDPNARIFSWRRCYSLTVNAKISEIYR